MHPYDQSNLRIVDKYSFRILDNASRIHFLGPGVGYSLGEIYVYRIAKIIILNYKFLTLVLDLKYGLGPQANILNGPAVMASTPLVLITIIRGKTNVYGTAALGLPINNTIHISICPMGIK